MPYTPGDNWIICDLTSKKVLMSQSMKTWDGLRVAKEVWYPKHPQLSLKAIPDRMAVIDGRGRPADIYTVPQFGYGSFCLVSNGGIYWTFTVEDDGALVSFNIEYGNPVRYLNIGGYHLYVDNDGALHPEASGVTSVQTWKMRSPGDFIFDLSVASDLALLVTPGVWYS